MPLDIQQVISSVDKSWPKDYILRYLYVNLAPCFQRDLGFFLATYEEKLRQFKLGFYDNGTKVVCSTLVDYYIRIFAMFDIRAEKIIATSSEIPLFAMIAYGERGAYFMDPLGDLMGNQYGLQTRHFATIPRYETVKRNYPGLASLDDFTLRRMDADMGMHECNVYMSDCISQLRRELTVRAVICKTFGIGYNDTYLLTKKKLEIVRSELINVGNVPGLFERMQLYTHLREQLFDREEKANTDIVFNFDDPDRTTLNFLISYPGYEHEVYEESRDSRGQFHLDRIK